MTITLNNRRDFTLEHLKRVAINGESIRISRSAKRSMNEARKSFMAYLNSDRSRFIYGTTSGAGHHASQRLNPRQQKQMAQQRNRVAPGGGFGPDYLPERVVRMIIFARLTNYIEGHAKTRSIESERIAQMLDNPLPKVPLSGQVGAGEILPLAHVMSHMPHGDTEEAEPMARVNGSPVSTAVLCDVALSTQNRLALAYQIFSLSIEAYGAPLAPYSASLLRYSQSHYEKQAIRSLRYWLNKASTKGRLSYQAPVSWRILPPVFAAAEEAYSTVLESAETSLQAVTDNPVYILPNSRNRLGRVISTGGYHNAQAAPAIDDINARYADLCTLADRHTMKLHSAEHLPPNLAAPAGESYGTAMLSFLQVGYGEEARLAARRSFLPASEGGGIAGQNDVASVSVFAYQKHLRSAFCLEASLTLLATSASQALWLTKRKPAHRLTTLLETIRDLVPPVTTRTNRNLGAELETLQQHFETDINSV
ncbi:MAG: histidine ammonia-lyase [SAR202 cluster bacterium]|nr:histidine ammonia-lyase [SAR202 cluster bacterium]